MVLVEVLIPLALFAAIFGILYLLISSRHREKMYMMENNLDPKEYNLKSGFMNFQTLKIGMLMIGLSMGLLVGHWLSQLLSPDGEIAYPAMVLLFGGLSLVAHHFVRRRSLEESESL